jgi:hypothetical protein
MKNIKNNATRDNPFNPYYYRDMVFYAKTLTRKELNNYGFADADELIEVLEILYTLKEKDRNSTIIRCEDINQFISAFRKLYYSGRKKSFRQFLGDIDELTDKLD